MSCFLFVAANNDDYIPFYSRYEYPEANRVYFGPEDTCSEDSGDSGDSDSDG